MQVIMAAAVHISLNVSNLNQSVGFYRRFLGEPTKLKADYAKFVAQDPEIHLALQPGRVARESAGALSHFGIRVDSAEQVLRWKKALTDRGLPTEEASGRPAATPCRTSSGSAIPMETAGKSTPCFGTSSRRPRPARPAAPVFEATR
jgi:catechol 2,3-dioxygenase-like lactoylglutathione lyase family enzyme